jgi:flagellar biogenesis protein FliO
VSAALLMVAAMLFAVGLVGGVAWLFVRGAEQPEDRVSVEWRNSHLRERRDQ